jgi:DNA polymerase III subunit gamma/tau
MTYQVLARKWRPQNFSSLVGQGPIVTALRNALKEGRIAQAYLFSGIRGVGKTTAARVLAKALNCERGPAADPCNECTACVEITRGADLDVIEVDAATYSKVEQVRELTESLKYGPARDRYKVVVLDEVHRLSRQAFDALLKIVEEPPPHLVFIFATTEIEAVPATILSRCQEFHFRRVPVVEVTDLLRSISGDENITASEAALRLIARAGEGSVRDAVALLDQLATFGSGTISDEEAIRLLGGLDTALFGKLLRAIVAGDGAGVVELVQRIEDEGWDPRHVYGQFLAFCRDALHLSLGGSHDSIDLPAEEVATLSETAKGAGYENLLRLVHQLLQSEATVRRSETGALAVEIAWLRAAELPKLRQIEDLLAGVVPAQTASAAAGRPAAPAPEPARRNPEPVRPASGAGAPKSAPAPRTAPAAPPAPAAPVAAIPEALPEVSDSLEPEEPFEAEPVELSSPAVSVNFSPAAAVEPSGDGLSIFLAEVSRLKQPLVAHLEHAETLRLGERGLEIVSPPGDSWLETKLRRGNNWQILEQAAAVALGPGTAVRLVEGSGVAKAPTVSAVKLEMVAENPTIQTVLDIFQGRVERIEEHTSVRED